MKAATGLGNVQGKGQISKIISFGSSEVPVLNALPVMSRSYTTESKLIVALDRGEWKVFFWKGADSNDLSACASLQEAVALDNTLLICPRMVCFQG